MFSFLVFAAVVAKILAADVDRLQLLETRFEHLENKVQALENKVFEQQHEILAQRGTLGEKSKEIMALRELLKESSPNNLQMKTAALSKASVLLERRFVLDKDDVAFFARLDETELTGVTTNQTILFDNVVLNAGNAFNIKTGQFIAPVDGFYSLSVSVASDLGHNHALQVALMKNGNMLARAHAHGDSGHLDQGGVTIVAGLAAGDKVYISSTYTDVTDFYGGGLTTFSGYHVMFK